MPLDYADPDGEKATVALVKLASKLSSKDTKYRGPILFNPGKRPFSVKPLPLTVLLLIEADLAALALQCC